MDPYGRQTEARMGGTGSLMTVPVSQGGRKYEIHTGNDGIQRLIRTGEGAQPQLRMEFSSGEDAPRDVELIEMLKEVYINRMLGFDE